MTRAKTNGEGRKEEEGGGKNAEAWKRRKRKEGREREGGRRKRKEGRGEEGEEKGGCGCWGRPASLGSERRFAGGAGVCGVGSRGEVLDRVGRKRAGLAEP